MIAPATVILIAGWAQTEQALEPLFRAVSPTLFRPGEISVSATSVSSLLSDSGSDPAPPTSGVASTYALALAARLTRQKHSANLIGWSMGGMVALETAIYFPERVDRLVLISSCPVFSTPDRLDNELPASRLRAMILGLHRERRETLRRFFSLMHSESRSEAQAAEDLRLAMQLEPPHLIHGLRYLQSVDLCPQLSAIQVPTLIIHGRKDRVISWQASLLLQKGIARSKLLLVDDGDHGLAATRPDVLAPAIVQFSNADPVYL